MLSGPPTNLVRWWTATYISDHEHVSFCQLFLVNDYFVLLRTINLLYSDDRWLPRLVLPLGTLVTISRTVQVFTKTVIVCVLVCVVIMCEMSDYYYYSCCCLLLVPLRLISFMLRNIIFYLFLSIILFSALLKIISVCRCWH